MNCTPRSIDEFPNDFMSEEQRRNGGVVFHIALTLYLFAATAIACDDFFVPSMKKISKGKLGRGLRPSSKFTSTISSGVNCWNKMGINRWFKELENCCFFHRTDATKMLVPFHWCSPPFCFTAACRIPPDVAGATLMAAGSSAPEFFAAVVGTNISKSH